MRNPCVNIHVLADKSAGKKKAARQIDRRMKRVLKWIRNGDTKRLIKLPYWCPMVKFNHGGNGGP